MSLLKMLQGAQGGQGLGELARQLGMDQDQVNGLADMLAPAIGSAAKKRTEQGGLEALLGQLQGEAQGGLYDDAARACAPEARHQGEDFLDKLLGSREATHQLASEAAGRSGVPQDQVEQFLPAMAAMLQGGMQRQMPDSSIQGLLSSLGGGTGQHQPGGIMAMLSGMLSSQGAGGAGGGLDLSMLTNMLDEDGDGSPLDDILEKIMK